MIASKVNSYRHPRIAVSWHHLHGVRLVAEGSLCFVCAMRRNWKALCRRGSSSLCIRIPIPPCSCPVIWHSPIPTPPFFCSPTHESFDCPSPTSYPPNPAPDSTALSRQPDPAVHWPAAAAIVDTSISNNIFGTLALRGRESRGLRLSSQELYHSSQDSGSLGSAGSWSRPRTNW